MSKEPVLMKDGLGPAAIERIGTALSHLLPDFPQGAFADAALAPFEDLALKERVTHVTTTIHRFLPASFVDAAAILLALPRHWDRGVETDPLRGFAIWPLIQYVPAYGLEHPILSLSVLKALTPLFSSEFAIRPFWLEHFAQTFEIVQTWCEDPDEHVRRLVSEGIRPRLPWGQQLKPLIQDPTPIFALLEDLKDDPSLYVRRSVANNLNDIAKDHPDAVIDLCQRWLEGASPERQWIVRHATRSLVKSGYPGVFGLLGLTDEPEVEVVSLSLASTQLTLGESLSFSAVLRSQSSVAQELVVDFSIHFRKANGQCKPKVFKGKQIDLAPEETVTFDKQHAIRPITTRKYYQGEQILALHINGKEVATQAFYLVIPGS